MTTVQKTALGAALAAALGTGVYQARQAARLSGGNSELRMETQQLADERDHALKRVERATRAAPQLPAPQVQPSSPASGTGTADAPPANSILRWIKGETPKLTPEQVESFLKENRRNAASLLAMARITGDASLLKEAIEKFPDDPRVAFDAVRKSASSEERRQWLDKFKQDAPDNALASYLSALDYFKSGQTDQAVQELVAASSKSQFSDYLLEFLQDAQEAWRAAGYSEADTRVLAAWQLSLSHVAQLKELHQNALDLARAYRQAGDEASARAVLQYHLLLGQQLAASDPIIHQIVGLIIQRDTLAAFDPATPYGTTGQTVASRLDQVVRQRDTLKAMFDRMDTLKFALSPPDWITFFDRAVAFGDVNAVQWAIDRYGNN